MKIFYFSGTGNSFFIAKKIAQNFTHINILSIADLRNEKEIQISNDDLVIVCPVYFYGLPKIVLNFLKKLNFENVNYFSIILTAEYPNGIAINKIKEICEKKNIKLNSCFYLKMPTNYLIKSKMLSSIEIENTLKKSEEKLVKIIDIIKMKKDYLEKESKIYSIIVNAEKENTKWQNETFLDFDSKFYITLNCNGCKLCETHCPVANISFDKKPIWNKKCEACLKCINLCPVQAIQYDNKTEGKKRYFNPEIKIIEIK